MVLIHFHPSFNLPDTRICSINGLAKLLSSTFKQGWKYYFTQIPSSVVPNEGKPYRYQIHCTSFPMTGGEAHTETVCYSNKRIRF